MTTEPTTPSPESVIEFLHKYHGVRLEDVEQADADEFLSILSACGLTLAAAPSSSGEAQDPPEADDLVATARRIGCTLANQLADEIERLPFRRSFFQRQPLRVR